MQGKILIIKHVESEGPGSIGKFLKDAARLIDIIELGKGGRLPGTTNGVDAIISMGGPMNVYEEEKYPFLKAENVFLQAALKKSIPILGICLGAQLIAKALGASVKKSPVREIGWYRISLTKDGAADPLFEGIKECPEVFQWHEDTFDIPEGGVRLAEHEGCRNQAFRFGRNIYGLQFHIETTPEMIKEWLEIGSVKKNESEKILMDTQINKNSFAEQAQIMATNFDKMIDSSGKARVA